MACWSTRIAVILLVMVCEPVVRADQHLQLHRALPSTNSAKPRIPSSAKSTNQQAERGQDSSYPDKAARARYHSSMDYGEERSAAWMYSIVSSILVGLSGIFPLIVIPLEAGASLKEGDGAARLKLLLSFAVGSLLGDVFLHLLPEAWATVGVAGNSDHITIGLWAICGLLSFMIIEKCFGGTEAEDESDECKLPAKNSTVIKPTVDINKNGYNLRSRNTQNGSVHEVQNGTAHHQHTSMSNGSTTNQNSQKDEDIQLQTKIHISGYLNLLANCIDNFTHGLAVAGSYLISPKVGLCTTIAILLHEIPHEVGDFAILLRSGFDRWKAAKAQILTASGGVLGALAALSAESAESAGTKTAWILPFTAGGFIYIALVTVAPDLLQEKSPRESLKQMLCIIAGVASMLMVTVMFE